MSWTMTMTAVTTMPSDFSGWGILATSAAVALLVPLAGAVIYFAKVAWDRDVRERPRLRLIPTANAWGFSDRDLLDESAVGL